MLSRLLLLSASRPAVTAAWMQHSRSRAGILASVRAIDTSLRYQSTDDSSSGASSNGIEGTSDDSAMSRSRAPFRMPRNSPDDSVPTKMTTAGSSSGSVVSSWNQLGLWTELIDALTKEMGLKAPTPVQNLVIPSLLQEHPIDTAFLAATGSGKTL